jgi:hypothetical protein
MIVKSCHRSYRRFKLLASEKSLSLREFVGSPEIAPKVSYSAAAICFVVTDWKEYGAGEEENVPEYFVAQFLRKPHHVCSLRFKSYIVGSTVAV